MSWLSNHRSHHFSLGVRSPSIEPEINLIPFIDVLLVVLIFLMMQLVAMVVLQLTAR